MPLKSRPIKSPLDQAKALANNALLEEGDHWFAVGMSWWSAFQSSHLPEKAAAVANEKLVDLPLSSKARKVALLKPGLSEGEDLIFLPEASWDVISQKLGFDYEVRREVVYLRSQQELQVEAYPFAFHLFYWPSRSRGDNPRELQDATGSPIVMLGSRAHTVGQLLSEIWLAAPEDFRHQFPQFLDGDGPPTTSDCPRKSPQQQTRLCYRTARPGDGELSWISVEKLFKRGRVIASPSQLKARAVKRQARGTGSDDDSKLKKKSSAGSEDEEVEFDENVAMLGERGRGGLGDVWDRKLGDLRLDNRSEAACGESRLHALLVEQQPASLDSTKLEAHLAWPSEAGERHWRMTLDSGHALDALDTSNNWFESRVLQARKNKVLVHYRGWESKWDEWLTRTSRRIAPPHAHVPRWRANLEVGDEVQVGLQVPGLKHVKWRNAEVIQVEQRTGGLLTPEEEMDMGSGIGSGADKDGSAWRRVHLMVDEDDLWMPVQDDLVCQLDTHQESKPLTQHERQLLAHDDVLIEDNGDDTTDITAQALEEEEEGDENEDDDDEEEEVAEQEALDEGGVRSPPYHALRIADAEVLDLTASPRVTSLAVPLRDPGRGRPCAPSIADTGLGVPVPAPAPTRTSARVTAPIAESRPGHGNVRAAVAVNADVLAMQTRLAEEFREHLIEAGEAFVELVQSLTESGSAAHPVRPRHQ